MFMVNVYIERKGLGLDLPENFFRQERPRAWCRLVRFDGKRECHGGVR